MIFNALLHMLLFRCISNFAVRFMNMTQLEKGPRMVNMGPKDGREKIILYSFD